jgi:hypothetical protein
MPKGTDIQKLMVIGVGLHDSRYLFKQFREMAEKNG